MYFIFVDTENDSGNFERQMTAFATGLLEHNGIIGKELAEKAQNEMRHYTWWADNIELQNDPEYDHTECWFPVTISATPGRFNNGYGVEYREDSEEAKQYTNKYPSYKSILITTKTSPPERRLG